MTILSIFKKIIVCLINVSVRLQRNGERLTTPRFIAQLSCCIVVVFYHCFRFSGVLRLLDNQAFARLREDSRFDRLRSVLKMKSVNFPKLKPFISRHLSSLVSTAR